MTRERERERERARVCHGNRTERAVIFAMFTLGLKDDPFDARA